MTQPPEDEPPWQPPGPPPPPQQGSQPGQQGPYPSYPYPYGSPPQANPYGGGSTTPYQPIESGGMPTAVKVVLGVVIGLVGGFVLWFVAAIGFASSGTSSDGFLLFAALAPLVVPAPLLFWPAARPWGAGMLIGTAISTIGLSSLCSALITGL